MKEKKTTRPDGSGLKGVEGGSARKAAARRQAELKEALCFLSDFNGCRLVRLQLSTEGLNDWKKKSHAGARPSAADNC